jgi:hypothetical protein
VRVAVPAVLRHAERSYFYHGLLDVPKDRISKLTEHRSEELERYLHMSLAVRVGTSA